MLEMRDLPESSRVKASQGLPLNFLMYDGYGEEEYKEEDHPNDDPGEEQIQQTVQNTREAVTETIIETRDEEIEPSVKNEIDNKEDSDDEMDQGYFQGSLEENSGSKAEKNSQAIPLSGGSAESSPLLTTSASSRASETPDQKRTATTSEKELVTETPEGGESGSREDWGEKSTADKRRDQEIALARLSAVFKLSEKAELISIIKRDQEASKDTFEQAFAKLKVKHPRKMTLNNVEELSKCLSTILDLSAEHKFSLEQFVSLLESSLAGSLKMVVSVLIHKKELSVGIYDGLKVLGQFSQKELKAGMEDDFKPESKTAKEIVAEIHERITQNTRDLPQVLKDPMQAEMAKEAVKEGLTDDMEEKILKEEEKLLAGGEGKIALTWEEFMKMLNRHLKKDNPGEGGGKTEKMFRVGKPSADAPVKKAIQASRQAELSIYDIKDMLRDILHNPEAEVDQLEQAKQKVSEAFFKEIKSQPRGKLSNYLAFCLKVANEHGLSQSQTVQLLLLMLGSRIKDVIGVLASRFHPLKTIVKYLLALNIKATKQLHVQVAYENFSPDHGQRARDVLKELKELILLLLNDIVTKNVPPEEKMQMLIKLLMIKLEQILPSTHIARYGR